MYVGQRSAIRYIETSTDDAHDDDGNGDDDDDDDDDDGDEDDDDDALLFWGREEEGTSDIINRAECIVGRGFWPLGGSLPLVSPP